MLAAGEAQMALRAGLLGTELEHFEPDEVFVSRQTKVPPWSDPATARERATGPALPLPCRPRSRVEDSTHKALAKTRALPLE